MKIRKAFKYRLKPTDEQAQKLHSIAGHCRFAWNRILHLNLTRLKDKQPLIWYHEADYWTKLWKRSEEYGFLKEVPAHCLQQKLKDLDKAFREAFDKTQPLKRLPKTRKQGLHDSIRFPEAKHIQVDNRRIKLPKLGWMRFVKSRGIEGDIKNATVSRLAGKWFVSIQVEQELKEPTHPSQSALGVDLGIAHFAACSDGVLVKSKSAFRHYEAKLAKAQRQLSKKKHFSSNWKKQKSRIQRIHSKIANTRKDFLNKLSTQLSKNHAMIVVEDLKVKGMSSSAKGNADSPGKNVKAKSGLNKSILDQGWGELCRQLEYKLTWLGGSLLKVNPRYTSQKCHDCGHTEKANRASQSVFQCQSCGHKAHADINAARNILAAGHAVLACGERALAYSMKQEPLETGNLLPA